MNKLDKLSIAAIRSTCIDMINAANSGHPGMALGSAPIVYTLFKNHIVADPYDPTWLNRDRFVLSAGHASSLLYTMLHLCDYRISMDDLKQFRKLNSITPGHPEVTHTPGVDATSGPLGQGISTAVGMAIAEAHLNVKYEKYIDHYTYVLCGDGCLQEGVSQEAISIAGQYKLNKLIVLYDSNNVTLDGPLSLSSIENTKMRFQAAGWDVLEVADGNDIDAIDRAISKAKKSSEKPTLIIVTTVIGYGSSVAGTSKAHGAPLKADDIVKTKEFYGYDYPEFTIPEEVYKNFKDNFIKKGYEAHVNWLLKTEKLRKSGKLEVYDRVFGGDLSEFLENNECKDFDPAVKEATRKSSQNALTYYNSVVPNLIGGSADVAGSVLTNIPGTTKFTAENRAGTSFDFGIREFGMACAANGIALHGGLRPFVGCFMVFSDYMKSAIRMSALSKLPVIYIFSHDSISVGEDGPTHQPIEQLAMLRSIPDINVVRPADARETFAAYHEALKLKNVPTAIVTCRNNLPLLENSSYEGVKNGGYVISKEENHVDFTIVATGTEVSLAIEAQKLLKSEGIDVRVVSLPSFYAFDKQSNEYKKETFGTSYENRIFVEMSSSFGLHKYAAHTMSVDHFGASANFADLAKYYDFTSERLAKTIKNLLKGE